MFIVRNRHTSEIHKFSLARDVAAFMQGKDAHEYELYSKIYDYPTTVKKMEELLKQVSELMRKKDV